MTPTLADLALSTRARNVLILYVERSLGVTPWGTMDVRAFDNVATHRGFLRMKGAGRVSWREVYEAVQAALASAAAEPSGAPGPIPDPPNVEKAIRDAIVADAATMLSRLSILLSAPRANALRILRVARGYAKAMGDVLSDLALEKEGEEDGDDDLDDGGYASRLRNRIALARNRPRDAYLDPDADPAHVAGNMTEALHGQEIQGLGATWAKARRDGDRTVEAWTADRLRALGAPIPPEPAVPAAVPVVLPTDNGGSP